MKHYDFGNFAFSKAGHDKDELYVILYDDIEYVYLVDGKIRTLEKPKRKNKKHVQLIHVIEDSLQKKINEEKKITNEDIKRAIKCYKSKVEI